MSTMRSGSLVHTPDGRWVQAFDDENDVLHDAWARRIAAKYRRLSYYPWLAAEHDAPPPQRLAHPRGRWKCRRKTIRLDYRC